MSSVFEIAIETDVDGVIRVGGTRVTLDTLVEAFNEGATAEEIVQQYPSLELGDVYAVIGYYLHNQTDVEQYLERRREEASRVRRENEARFDPKGIRERLLARRH
ncbi:MAG TPA: DUF433 domain-containing protein [Blastocatellia bacterium]|nr:DUF433 domain-containing protein [Blastocatellia bacterium]